MPQEQWLNNSRTHMSGHPFFEIADSGTWLEILGSRTCYVVKWRTTYVTYRWRGPLRNGESLGIRVPMCHCSHTLMFNTTCHLLKHILRLGMNREQFLWEHNVSSLPKLMYTNYQIITTSLIMTHGNIIW